MNDTFSSQLLSTVVVGGVMRSFFETVQCILHTNNDLFLIITFYWFICELFTVTKFQRDHPRWSICWATWHVWLQWSLNISVEKNYRSGELVTSSMCDCIIMLSASIALCMALYNTNLTIIIIIIKLW